MTPEHVAIRTNQLEILKDYYVKYFQGKSNNKYTNSSKDFHSYFLSFAYGARLELLAMPGIAVNQNDSIQKRHRGIIHHTFGADTKEEVKNKQNNCRLTVVLYLAGTGKPAMDIMNPLR